MKLITLMVYEIYCTELHMCDYGRTQSSKIGGGGHILFVGDVTITDTGFILYDAVRYVYNIAIGVKY